jgi:hypothetical protein
VLNVLGQDTPHLLLLNKNDLPDWEVTDAHVGKALALGIKTLRTSAKMGTAVNEAFETLARDMLART